jgi:hypothetical protein
VLMPEWLFSTPYRKIMLGLGLLPIGIVCNFIFLLIACVKRGKGGTIILFLDIVAGLDKLINLNAHSCSTCGCVSC